MKCEDCKYRNVNDTGYEIECACMLGISEEDACKDDLFGDYGCDKGEQTE